MGGHNRFYIDSIIKLDTISIIGEQFRQISRVLRMHEGDSIVLFDGTGNEYTAIIKAINKKQVDCKIVETTTPNTEPKVSLSVAICLPKGEKTDTIIQKCTEIGSSEFYLVTSHNTVVKIDESKIVPKLTRYKRIAIEASEQCGRVKIPKIVGIIDVNVLVKMIANHDFCVIAWENEKQANFKTIVGDKPGIKSVLYIVGPEGGFTAEEIELLINAGARPISLGTRLLRTETAAIIGSAVIIHHFEGR
jgi:16S rRNA (uracil1498-N3)-methyltransferase